MAEDALCPNKEILQLINEAAEDKYMLISLLHKHNTPGIHYAICRRLVHLDISSIIPQLVQIMLEQAEASPPIYSLLMQKAQRSLSFQTQLFLCLKSVLGKTNEQKASFCYFLCCDLFDMARRRQKQNLRILQLNRRIALSRRDGARKRRIGRTIAALPVRFRMPGFQGIALFFARTVASLVGGSLFYGLDDLMRIFSAKRNFKSLAIKRQTASPFKRNLLFYDTLVAISNRLRKYNASLRQRSLEVELEFLTITTPYTVMNPFDPSTVIVNIVAEECITLDSADNAPYLVVTEIAATRAEVKKPRSQRAHRAGILQSHLVSINELGDVGDINGIRENILEALEQVLFGGAGEQENGKAAEAGKDGPGSELAGHPDSSRAIVTEDSNEDAMDKKEAGGVDPREVDEEEAAEGPDTEKIDAIIDRAEDIELNMQEEIDDSATSKKNGTSSEPLNNRRMADLDVSDKLDRMAKDQPPEYETEAEEDILSEEENGGRDEMPLADESEKEHAGDGGDTDAGVGGSIDNSIDADNDADNSIGDDAGNADGHESTPPSDEQNAAATGEDNGSGEANSLENGKPAAVGSPAANKKNKNGPGSSSNLIHSHKNSWKSVKEKIRIASKFSGLPGWSLLSFIVKSGSVMKQEYLAYQLLSQMKDIFSRECCPIFLKNYKIYLISETAGLVEAITDAYSIHRIKREWKSLAEYFNNAFSDAPLARANFLHSLVGYSLASFLIQIKDRHNGNILIDATGHVIHVDFGFILGGYPGFYCVENAPFKFSADYLDLIDMASFRTLFLTGFEILRAHAAELTLLMEVMEGSGFCDVGTVAAFLARLHLGDGERELEEYCTLLIDRSVNNMRTAVYDKFQYFSNGYY